MIIVSNDTIAEIDTVTVLVKVTVTETNIVTVPTQNYECRNSDSDKQAGKMTETFVKTLTKTATQTSIETPNETEKRHRLSDCKT